MQKTELFVESQVMEQLLKVLLAVKKGDFSARMRVDRVGLIGKIADTLNDVIQLNADLVGEIERLRKNYGREGLPGDQVNFSDVMGDSRAGLRSLNELVASVTRPDVLHSQDIRLLENNVFFELPLDIMLCTVGANGYFRQLNPAFQILGYTKEEVLAKPFIGFVHPDDVTTTIAEVKRLGQQGRTIYFENRYRCKDDTYRWLAWTGSSDTVGTLYMVARDMTEHRQAEDRFRMAIEAAPTGMLMIDSSGKMVLVNTQLERIFGYSRAELIGNKLEILLPERFRGQHPQHRTGFFRDPKTRSMGTGRELYGLRKNGTEVPVEIGLNPLRTAEGDFVLGSIVDITARAEAEQQRSQLARNLERSNQYKSEFLANMSHELRTPLNSLLILSNQLSCNQDGNLMPRQVEFAKTIHASGNELLNLINDILDLSKIESGTVTVEISEISLDELKIYIQRTFSHVAEARGLRFELDFAQDLPRSLHTDTRRLQQILKNLLSNAFKFTERGVVKLTVMRVTSGWSPDHDFLSQTHDGIVAFEVADTGVGIPADKQQIIFEAFQQVEGSTSRKYGGTGLGLAISRELSRMLGGEIRITSELGVGSRFTLYLPFLSQASVAADAQATIALSTRSVTLTSTSTAVVSATNTKSIRITDDRERAQAGELTVLIVDDDQDILDFSVELARSNDLKVLTATSGGEAVWLAREFQPIGILLDIKLDDIDGWRVLDYLKSDHCTRHIPISIMSVDDQTERGLLSGARRVIRKLAPRENLAILFRTIRDEAARADKRLLLVEDEIHQREDICRQLSSEDLQIVPVETGAEALEQMRSGKFDVVVMDIGLPDTGGNHLLQQFHTLPNFDQTPIIVHTAKDLAPAEAVIIQQYCRAVVVKDSRRSLLSEIVSLWLHRKAVVETENARLADIASTFYGKRVLIVDDDIRNIFSLNSLLERYEMHIVTAESGKAAIEIIQTSKPFDVVLMDIMMPEMDGYDTMRAIRKIRHTGLPIIALTAKAMHGDREKCFEAGASDYVTKPVDSASLISRLRAWLGTNPMTSVRDR